MLQKWAYPDRRPERLVSFFEAIHYHPLDCAGTWEFDWMATKRQMIVVSSWTAVRTSSRTADAKITGLATISSII